MGRNKEEAAPDIHTYSIQELTESISSWGVFFPLGVIGALAAVVVAVVLIVDVVAVEAIIRS